MLAMSPQTTYGTLSAHVFSQSSIQVSYLRRKGKFSTNLSPSGRIRQVQNTISCHTSGTMNLNSIRLSTVRGHAPYKYPPRNAMPKSSGTNSNSLRISGSDTSFSPTDELDRTVAHLAKMRTVDCLVLGHPSAGSQKNWKNGDKNRERVDDGKLRTFITQSPKVFVLGGGQLEATVNRANRVKLARRATMSQSHWHALLDLLSSPWSQGWPGRGARGEVLQASPLPVTPPTTLIRQHSCS